MVAQDTSPSAFLETPEGEISFFRSIMRARPVGIHRHFHILTIRNAIHRDTGHLIAAEDIWSKLKGCYNLDALEGLVSIHRSSRFTLTCSKHRGRPRKQMAMKPTQRPETQHPCRYRLRLPPRFCTATHTSVRSITSPRMRRTSIFSTHVGSVPPRPRLPLQLRLRPSTSQLHAPVAPTGAARAN